MKFHPVVTESIASREIHQQIKQRATDHLPLEFVHRPALGNPMQGTPPATPSISTDGSPTLLLQAGSTDPGSLGVAP